MEDLDKIFHALFALQHNAGNPLVSQVRKKNQLDERLPYPRTKTEQQHKLRRGDAELY